MAKPKNNKTKVFLLIALMESALFFSCKQKKEQQINNAFMPLILETSARAISKDSIQLPKSVPVGTPKIVRVGNPRIDSTNLNIHPALGINVPVTRPLRVCIPGKDTFELPISVPIIDSPFVAGIPEVTLAKDAVIKDQNPQNFSSFNKLQGLNQGNVNCLFQDHDGNLWIGMTEGGVSKFDGKNFTLFTDKEGLSHSNVLCILEDQRGNIWFGTLGGGAIKYDGKNFTVFKVKEGLSHNVVRNIMEDKKGNIWFCTQNGVTRYDGNRVESIEAGEKISLAEQVDLAKKNGKLIKSFTYFNMEQGLSGKMVLDAVEDKKGNIWFATLEGGVSKYDGRCFIHYTTLAGLIHNDVCKILEDKQGNMWFGTWSNGISRLSEDGTVFTNYNESSGLSNHSIRTILEDKNEEIWFGTNGGGLSKLNKTRDTFTHFATREGLPNNKILCSLQDKSNNIWFGSFGGGLTKYDGRSFSHYSDKDGLLINDIRSITEDWQGNVWLGYNGAGVSKFNGSCFAHYTEQEGLVHNTVLSIMEDRNKNIWFGTLGGGVCKLDADGKNFNHYTMLEGLAFNSVLCIVEDRKGNIWFGCSGQGVSRLSSDGKVFTTYNTKSGMSENHVRCITEDRKGNIWFGTNGGGLTKFAPSSQGDGTLGEFTHFTTKEGLGNNTIRSMIEDKKGNLWIGLLSDGISVLSSDGKYFTKLTTKEGLVNNNVFNMLEDRNGNLWFGTRVGVSKLEIKKLVPGIGGIKLKNPDMPLFKNFTYEDGFLGIGVNGGNTICEDKNGNIWFGANDRVTVFHPTQETENTDTVAPNIKLTGIELFNENIPWAKLTSAKADTNIVLGNGVKVGNFEFKGVSAFYSIPENLSLAYDNNYLTFDFIGVSQKSPKKIRYQYKLDGIDKNWSAITNRTAAPFGNLPQGTYTFRVKAQNSEGYWSNEYKYVFTIRPPWWKTWWFSTFAVILIISGIFYYIWQRERKLIERQQELERKIAIATEDINNQKHVIEDKHKEITDSINYAERIQRSFLATAELLKENLKEYFVIFQPKDVVSGDFYWASKLSNGQFALATADSTGHGVPGAIMSILNISSLEKAVEQELCEPSEILNYTRKTIIARLKKDGSAEGGKDGMDASLLCFDFTKNKFSYAAANNPVWVVRENNLIELLPDKMPVGKHDKDAIPFTQHEFELAKGDLIYTITDGFPDQFGGEKGKKFMSKKLKEHLISISHLTMEDQKRNLLETFNSWKGEIEQVDDVTLIGIRV